MSVRKRVPFTLVLLGLSAITACDHPHPATAEKEEPKTAAVTVWGDRFEVFLEHRLIVVNEPVTFLAHITDLKTLEPRRKDPVTFILAQGSDEPIKHVEPEPKRPGIYQPELKFPKPGDWSVKLLIPIDGTESVVELPKFHVFASRDEAEKAPEAEESEGISFLKEQQWKVLTKTEPAVKRKMVERLRLPGVVAIRPGLKAAVTPPVAGRLLAPAGKAFSTLGDRVEAGQTLALVQPPFSDFAAKIVEAEAAVIKGKLALDQAEQTLTRIKKLHEGQARSERELREAEFALRSAQAQHQAAFSLKATYQKAGAILLEGEGGGLPVLELKAPISGTIVHVSAAVGEYVPSDRSVFSILDTAIVLIEARIPEADLGRMGTARGAFYENPAEKGQFVPILGEGGGRVVLLGAEVDPATRTIPLIYEVKNPEERLRIGMALTLELETDRAEDAIAIPVTAVVDEDARPIAFVQVSGETFEKRSLKLGIREGAFVQVLDGIAEGERIVTKEAYTIRLSSVSSVIPAHGHSH